MSKCKSPLWSHHGNSFNQTYKFEQKDVYTVEWLQFYSLVTGLKNFHFFTTHVEWPKTLFVLSGLIYICVDIYVYVQYIYSRFRLANLSWNLTITTVILQKEVQDKQNERTYVSAYLITYM